MKYTTEASRNRNSCKYQNEKKIALWHKESERYATPRKKYKFIDLRIWILSFCSAKYWRNKTKTVQQKIWRLNTSLQPYWFCRFVNGQFWAKAQTPFHRKVSSHWGFRHLLRVFFMLCGFYSAIISLINNDFFPRLIIIISFASQMHTKSIDYQMSIDGGRQQKKIWDFPFIFGKMVA